MITMMFIIIRIIINIISKISIIIISISADIWSEICR